MEIKCCLYVFEAITCYVYISAPVVALKDCWFISDFFLSEIFHELPVKNSANRLAKLPPLYIYGNYTVNCYLTHPLTSRREIPVTACLVNSLINAINDNKYLPRHIVVIPDWDLVKEIVNVKTNLFVLMEKLIKWIVINMNRAVKNREDDLRKFSDGAITYGEPKWLWVRMIVE